MFCYSRAKSYTNFRNTLSLRVGNVVGLRGAVVGKDVEHVLVCRDRVYDHSVKDEVSP